MGRWMGRWWMDGVVFAFVCVSVSVSSVEERVQEETVGEEGAGMSGMEMCGMGKSKGVEGGWGGRAGWLVLVGQEIVLVVCGEGGGVRPQLLMPSPSSAYYGVGGSGGWGWLGLRVGRVCDSCV